MLDDHTPETGFEDGQHPTGCDAAFSLEDDEAAQVSYRWLLDLGEVETLSEFEPF